MSALSGENGIIKRAQEAKEKTQMAEEKDRLDLELLSIMAGNEGRNPTVEDYLNHLIEQGIITEEDIVRNEDGSVDIVTDTGLDATVKENEEGEIEVEVHGKVEDAQPRIISIELEATTSSIKVVVKGRFIDSYKIEYKEKDGDTEYREGAELIENLVHNKWYTIKVTAKNKNGEVEATKDAITIEVPSASGTITFGDTTWDKDTHTASVTITKSSEEQYENFTLQYRKGENGNYTPVPSGSIIVSDLALGDVVYAQLVDASNNAGKSSSVTVDDGTPPEAATISITGVAETGVDITASVTQVDNQSGVDIGKCKWVYNTNSGTIGTDAANYTGGTFSTNPQDIKVKATTAGTYYLHVLTIDKAGRATEKVSSKVTVSVPSAANGAGAVTFGNVTWNKDTHKASVTITKNTAAQYSGLTLQWKKGDSGVYANATNGSVTVSDLNLKDVVYVQLVDSNGKAGSTGSVTVDDGTPPGAATITIASTANTGVEITAKVTQVDDQSGVDIGKCKWVYNTNSGTIGTDAANYTGGTFSTNPQDIKVKATTAGNYYLHVLTIDKAGKATEKVSSKVTVSVPSAANGAGAVTFGNVTWDKSTHKASVTITKSTAAQYSGLTLQWKKGDSGTYTKVTSGTVTVSDLALGDVVYAQLVDANNVGGSTGSVTVQDTVAPGAATISIASTANTGVEITAKVTQVDDQSGVDIGKCKWVYNTNSGTIGTDAANYTGGTFSANPQDIKVKATTAGNYYLHVLTIDKAGKATEKVSSKVTVSVPSAANGAGAVTFGNVTWNANTHKASVTITKSTAAQYNGLTLQWKKGDSGTYTKVTSGTVTVSDLALGDVVYAQLVDANNVGGSTGSVTVQDGTAPSTPTVSGYTSGTWVGSKVSITLSSTDGQSGVKTYQVKEGTGSWTNCSNPYTKDATYNGNIQFRAVDNANNASAATSTIALKIDKAAPSNATIKFGSATTVTTDTATSVTATVTQADANSGVKIAQCKWVYNTNSGTIGTNAASYTGGTFSQTTQNISFKITSTGTYYLHVLTVDNVGNAKETISGAITVDVVKATKITVQNMNLPAETKKQLSVTTTPSTIGEQLEYSSNNTGVATVTSTGEVTGVKKGTATITVKGKKSGVIGTCTVRVGAGYYQVNPSLDIVAPPSCRRTEYGYEEGTDGQGVLRLRGYSGYSCDADDFESVKITGGRLGEIALTKDDIKEAVGNGFYFTIPTEWQPVSYTVYCRVVLTGITGGTPIEREITVRVEER